MAEVATPGKKRAAGLYSIIAIKLGKGLALFALAIGIYSLIGDDLRVEFDNFIRFLRLDPEHKFFLRLGERLEDVTPANIRWVASGTMIYSLLLFVESAGLARRASWAAWLAIGETAFFIPVEVYKLLEKTSGSLAMILCVNILMVWYLVKNRERLFRH
ncbi:MAG TPA: DUF2127 domain-containing protein [Verrucomicrobiae bacterium]|nr:DUF2127 domain-containing protein [Verrucomicrobiae bacterium]